MKPIALQLYSVRDHLEKDLDGSLKKIREAGFMRVETAGFYGLSAEEFRDKLSAAGLSAISAHVPFEAVSESPQTIIRDAHTLGVEYVVVPWLDYQDAAGWIAAGSALGAAAQRFHESGIPLCYHNHEHEFQMQFDGARVFDLIFDNAGEHLGLQLDCGWCVVGGEDPVRLIKRYGHRVPMVHIKDWRLGPEGKPKVTELGRGRMVWGPIFDAAKNAGVRWYIAEQDESVTDSLESAARNAQFMVDNVPR
jgi:sugar phosphate isomerase/epimerase